MNTLLIGKSKAGKTRALETLPGATLIFSFDVGGWHSLYKRKKNVIVTSSFRDWLVTVKEPLTSNDILVVEYLTKDKIKVGGHPNFEATLLTNFILDHNSLWDEGTIEKSGLCHTSIDSLTGWQQPTLEFIVALNNRSETSQRDYGMAINKINEMVQSCVNLPLDFILTGHTVIEKDDTTGMIKEELMVYGKQLPTIICAKFDEILLSVRQRTPTGLEYLWATVPEGWMETAGCRNFDGLPPKIEQNFVKLYGDKLYHVNKQTKEV